MQSASARMSRAPPRNSGRKSHRGTEKGGFPWHNGCAIKQFSQPERKQPWRHVGRRSAGISRLGAAVAGRPIRWRGIRPDAGDVPLRELDPHTGVTARVSACWVDQHGPASVEHGVREPVSPRTHGIALGDEDLNDHGELRNDALLSLPAGKGDLTGENRNHRRDCGHALASAGTLNRMALGEPQGASRDRCPRLVADLEALDG